MQSREIDIEEMLANCPRDGEHLPSDTLRDPVAQLKLLEELLKEPDLDIVDDAFPVHPEEGRCRGVRHPYLADVVAVLPRFLTHEASSTNCDESDPEHDGQNSFDLVRGWTQTLSPDGITFILGREIRCDSCLLLVNHPDFSYPACSFDAHIFRSTQVRPGEWEYAAVLRPMSPFSRVGVLPV